MRIMSASQYDGKRSVDAGTREQQEAVKAILTSVRQQGDEALRYYTERFDRVLLQNFRVSESEFAEASELVSPQVKAALKEAAENIRAFHERQVRQSWFTTKESGTLLGQLIRPLQRAGLYVPGGTAAYPSSVLMNAIPAKIAGVPEVVITTPPGADGKINPAILVAAQIAGVTEIYKVGGAQAIAALTYGTEQIKAVDKIVGPGNIFVALAKREVFGLVSIDMVAGPSEIAVIADETANPQYVAADLLSQAEHDPMSAAILVTTSKSLAEQVSQEIERQLADLPRKSIAEAAIRDYGAILLVDDLDEGFAVINRIAPEHLEIMMAEPFEHLGKVENAGAIFLGPYSSEPVGDYFAGTNHVIPTNGTARFSSPLSVDDFIKKSSVVSYSKRDLRDNGHKIVALAEQEGLSGHGRAILARLRDFETEEQESEKR
ncbi:histidinol dehydrogenase [Brevibacillus porteri]|uniref:Histidinol dehydrogenase n=1 Tax=Brevibacillus porteri TaxID=2126350 RepID=A0ABX5FPE2_9BACL|nr:histidinol dehydrogenase [Brevibacillus porteri]MED1801514.1 histidinol dehydrogenase [Brevibacillus porteri]MED2133783.1 histidinol dehydrogenase [Brevibacillus porteri]MED2748189.1 histidinol dehydrogenase [Brevibacillus porteri]MED2815327.1 histidinol dehydrogenase [Brevibacillus porteri]MED2894866.1 histidinol dehydrogenase [Brevibacillus porteri]